MLDQSFSAKNFEIIYNLESRKGNIDIQNMPDDYIQAVKGVKEIKALLSQNQRDKKASPEIVQQYKEQLKEAIARKQLILEEYMTRVAEEVNGRSFRFHLKSKVIDKHEVFMLDHPTHAHQFAIKQLQLNIQKTFKVKQAARHNILVNIKTFITGKMPLYIIRTDISSFYESIPHDKLLPMVTDNTLLSNKSKAFIKGIIRTYEDIKNTMLAQSGHGVPRGVGISACLSEVYMRDIDHKIMRQPEVIFYARYVDDIFIILSALPSTLTIESYFNELSNIFDSYGLKLKQKNDGSGKCQLISLNKDNVSPVSFDYLGYNLSISRNGNINSVKFSMTEKKKDKILSRVDNAISHFEKVSQYDVHQAYHDLRDSVRYIFGNLSLFKSKRGVKIGLFFSNDLLDNLEQLEEITKELNSKTVQPFIKLKDYLVLKQKAEKILHGIKAEDRWIDKPMYKFSAQRIEEIQSWL